MKNKRLLDILGEMDERHIAEAAPAPRASRGRARWVKWGTLAACMVLLVTASLGAFAVVAEATEYKAAVSFFNDYGMSTDGLTRGEIKAVYHDITTESFTYSKTAEVILNSISSGSIGGYEIAQDEPTPEEICELWNYKTYAERQARAEQAGVHYQYRYDYKDDAKTGNVLIDHTYIDKYDGETLLWSLTVPDISLEDHIVVSDGVIAYGRGDKISMTIAWIVKISPDGHLVWQRMLNNGFTNEYISAVLENEDGSYAVFSRGNFKYFTLSQYTADGELISSRTTEAENGWVRNAVLFGDGYLVQCGNDILKVDREGNITDSFSYSDDNFVYTITDMLEFNGSIYLSAYAVPQLSEDEPTYGRSKIARILRYLHDNNIWDISSEELTPLVRDNYTALLLVCEPSTGEPREFYSVKGSLGGELAMSGAGELLWDVESITSTYYSPATSSFTIAGTSYVFRYTFDASGTLVSQTKTDETVNFRQ